VNTEGRIAIIGSKGMLGSMVRELAGCDILGLDLPEFDMTDREQVLDVLTGFAPEAIINCAAYTNVDGCESNEQTAARVNGDAPGYLAEAAKQLGAFLVHISTDYVFDGLGKRPYTEEDPTGPLSAYGRTKLRGEQVVFSSGLERFSIIRTSWLYGPCGKNFVETIVRLAKEREELRIVADQMGSPTYTGDLAIALFALLSKEAVGIYHFSNEGVCSWHEFAGAIVEAMKESGEQVKVRRIIPIRTEEYPLPAKRPAYSVLSKEKYKRTVGAEVPHWCDGLRRYFERRQAGKLGSRQADKLTS
jgi:dTDP-4-dehydrorhamnose reductase